MMKVLVSIIASTLFASAQILQPIGHPTYSPSPAPSEAPTESSAAPTISRSPTPKPTQGTPTVSPLPISPSASPTESPAPTAQPSLSESDLEAFCEGFGCFRCGIHDTCCAQVTPDPHFRTWHSLHYDYHGACDMVFVRSALLDLHIRTRNRGFWSTVTNAALRIGKDVIEVRMDGSYLLNGQVQQVPPSDVGADPDIEKPVQYPFHVIPRGVKILLGGGQYVLMQAYPSKTDLLVRVCGHHHYLGDATGMAGTFGVFGLIARDGVTEIFHTGVFAQVWEVQADDPGLFNAPSNSACAILPRRNLKGRGLQGLQELAEETCSFIQDDIIRQDCSFDIVASGGDVTLADNPAYTEPPPKVEEQCEATSNECACIGGTCVWCCDPTVTECIPGLCNIRKGVFELNGDGSDQCGGCSCSAPLGTSLAPSQTPSESPSMSPTTAPPTPICFPETAMVTTRHSRSIKMKDVHIGDWVLVVGGRYEKVYGFAHYAPGIIADNLQIEVESMPKPLQLSSNHLVFAENGNAVVASSLNVGDLVKTADGGSGKIIFIQTKKMRGAYVPLTSSGTIIVDNVLASSFASPNGNSALHLMGGTIEFLSYHFLAHLFETPHRFWCLHVSTCADETYTEDGGYSHWIDRPRKFDLWLQHQHVLIQTMLIVPWLATFLLLRAVEVSLTTSGAGTIVLVAAIGMYCILSRRDRNVHLKMD